LAQPQPQPQDAEPSPMTRTPPDLEIVNVPERRRYEARIGDQIAGWVEYGRAGGRLVALHTKVPPEFGGRGIASALVRHVIADARASGTRITPRCPFFVAHFERHPEDADVVAHPPSSANGG
jgi:predicted GNAT family acetyltransferase